MRRLFIIIISFTLLLPMYFAGSAFAGSIKGTVKVKGLRTPENVMVYLSKAPPASGDRSNAELAMDQRNLEFIPHVLPVLVGSTVKFPNNDKVDHNIFSMSRTKKFNLGSYKPGETKTMLFDKPGIVEIRCDVHAEMAAYILVMKNPYFAVTDKRGNFEIPEPNYLKAAGLENVSGLPPGKYIVKTWHVKLKGQKKSVVVPDSGDVSIKLDLTRGVPGVLYK